MGAGRLVYGAGARQLVCAAAGAWLIAHTGKAVLGGPAQPSLRARVVLHAEETATSTADRVQMNVLLPDGMGVTEACSEALLPSAGGQLVVLAKHVPMMTATDVGVLRLTGGHLETIGGHGRIRNGRPQPAVDMCQ